MADQTTDERETTVDNTGAVQLPTSMASFFATIPTEGGVDAKEEGTEKTAEELAAEEAAKKPAETEVDKPAEGEVPKKDAIEKPENTPAAPNKEEVVEEDTDSVIYALVQAFPDVEVEGEFESDEAGLIAVTNQIIAKKEALAKTAAIEELYTETPDLKVIAEHLKTGASLISLIQSQEVEDFSKVEIKEDDLATQEDMLRRALAAKGTDKKYIDMIVNTSKDSGTLLEDSKEGKQYLVDVSKDIIAKQVKAEQDEKKAQDELDLKQKGEIQEVIKAGQLHGIVLNTDMGKRLDDFIFKQDAKGKTERDKKYESLTQQQWLTLDAIVMEDFKPLSGVKPAADKSKKLTIKKASGTVNLSTGGKSVAATAAAKTFSDLGIDKVSDLFGGNNK